MATLSQMCILPQGWDAPAMPTSNGMNKKMAWKIEKRKQHQQLMAYRERERKRGGIAGCSLNRSRQQVRESLDAMGIVVKERIFEECKEVRSPKKAKNRVSKEQAGTIGRRIVVKRFDGSRLTCVCKSMIY